MAQTIGIGERTVKYHMSEILERLHLENRAQVMAYATQMRLARDGDRGREAESGDDEPR